MGVPMGIQRLFVLAFPPERCQLAEWLRVLPVADLGPVAPGYPPGAPNPPIHAAAVLREGALLYEVNGEPVAMLAQARRSQTT